MPEIEVKIFDVDRGMLETRLHELSALKQYEGLLIVKYFDFADRRIEKAGDLLRVRDFGDGKVEIVYKSNRKEGSAMKEMEEIIAMAKDFLKICEIFERLGFQETLTYEKKRVSFLFDKIKVEIDEYPNGFSYVEVEGESSLAIEKAIELLTLKSHERSAETVDEVFERKFGKGSLNGLRF